MDNATTFVEKSLGDNYDFTGIQVIGVPDNVIPTGKMWYSSTLRSVYVNRFSDLTYKHEWSKFLQQQRTLASRSLAGKVIEVRYNLGLPLR